MDFLVLEDKFETSKRHCFRMRWRRAGTCYGSSRFALLRFASLCIALLCTDLRCFALLSIVFHCFALLRRQTDRLSQMKQDSQFVSQSVSQSVCQSGSVLENSGSALDDSGPVLEDSGSVLENSGLAPRIGPGSSGSWVTFFGNPGSFPFQF